MGRERSSSATFMSKPGKYASHASRYLLRDLSAEDMVSLRSMRWDTTAPQIHALRPKAYSQFTNFLRQH